MILDDVLSVGELARRLRRAVEGVTGREWIEGEIASLSRPSSGHVYFTLKDEREDAVIDCVFYRMEAGRARRHLVEGARVQVLGRATVWAPRGRLQLVGQQARPAGRGALLEALEELKDKLRAEGLFEPERKRPLPPEPRIIGVVTSRDGAALHDIRTVAFRRSSVRLVLVSALVQGEDAPVSLVRALDLIERHAEIDVVIIGRGGGSGDDLMAFNDERVVRRIATMRIPVVSAVGHEIDITLTDLVADVRAATPSQAAEIVVPDLTARHNALRQLLARSAGSLETRLASEQVRVERLRRRLVDPRFVIASRQEQIDGLLRAIERGTEAVLAAHASRLARAHRDLSAQHPRAVVARSRARIAPLASRLDAAMRVRIEGARSRSAQAASRLAALSPLAVLERGYAIVTTSDGRAVRRAEDKRVGDALRVRLHQGALGVRIEQVDEKETVGGGDG